MKKKVLITILIIFLLICTIIGIWIFVFAINDEIAFSKDNMIKYSVINKNEIDISNNTISNEVEPEINTIVAESELKADSEKGFSKQDNEIVKKDTSQTSSIPTTSRNKNTASMNQKTQTNKTNTITKSTTSSSNVEHTNPKEKITETKPVTKPARCTNDYNHAANVGNCGKWFNSKNEAISYYQEKVKYWSDWWKNADPDDTEADDTYYKNCPIRYEYWDCMYCSKWSINLYYR